jgi:protein TonB
MSECEHQATGGTSVPIAPTSPIPAGTPPSTAAAPEPINHVRPRYPDEAKQFRIQGVVVLDAMISESGSISELHVARPVVGGGLEESAVEAVRQWRYLPTPKDGQPVSVGTCVTVTYEVYR